MIDSNRIQRFTAKNEQKIKIATIDVADSDHIDILIHKVYTYEELLEFINTLNQVNQYALKLRERA